VIRADCEPRRFPVQLRNFRRQPNRRLDDGDDSAHGGRKYGKARRIGVFDRGIVSEENPAAIRKRGGLYLKDAPRSQMKSSVPSRM
jgi:hypothetical protein